jgi:hypothetical protein
MKDRPLEHEVPEYEKPYVRAVPDGDLLAVLERQHEETLGLLSSLTEEQGAFRYAPGKWSILQVIAHIADNERIQAYRLLRFARGDATALPGYDQDQYVEDGPYDSWTLPQAAADYSAVRQATLTLLRGLRPEDWKREGVANNLKHSVLLLACVISGHEQHHLNILRERYLNE